MAYLWIISVGVSDIQFPVWKKNDYGEWQECFHFELARKGCRRTHEDLLRLLEWDQIDFLKDLPRRFKDRSADLKFELELIEETGFIASIRDRDSNAADPNFRISATDEAIPNTQEQKLPVYCAKAHELTGKAKQLFGDDPVTVVVINTKRNEGAAEAEGEPIAAGPLVAKFLARECGLTWQDNGGKIPTELPAGISTWVDILVGEERSEEYTSQQAAANRLTKVVDAWKRESNEHNTVVVTTSGGIPQLKQLHERIPAIRVGQDAVKILDKPDRRRDAEVTAVNYANRFIEQEILRFHCVEALRKQQYVTAYGLASRYENCECNQQVIRLLGPLLEFKNHLVRINDKQIDDRLVLTACRIEISLCMGDVVGALQRLGVFIESGIWTLIETDQRITQAGLSVDRKWEELRKGEIKQIPESLREKRKIKNLIKNWPEWLNENNGKEGGQAQKSQALAGLVKHYNDEQQDGSCLRDFRNHLAHGGRESDLNMKELEKKLRASGLMRDKNQPFGKNFLTCNVVKDFLDSLGGNVNNDINLIKNELGQLIEMVSK